MKLYISLSARKPDNSLSIEAINGFISASLVVLSKLNGRSTTQFKEDFPKWATASKPFVEEFGLSRVANKVFNVYAVKGNIPEELALELGKAMQAKRTQFDQNTDVPMEQFKLLKDIDNQLRTQGYPAWNRIHRDVRVLDNPKLAAAFPLEDEDGKEITVTAGGIAKAAATIRALVKKITGQNRDFLTLQENIDLGKSSPEQATSYRALVKEINAVVKKETFNFVRREGKHLVSISDLKSYLASKGIPNNLPTGFTGGQIDDLGKCYTAEGRPLTANPFGVVKMNPKYDPAKDNTYVMKGVDHLRTYRTSTFIESNKTARFSHVQEFIAKEDENRKLWLKDLSATDGRKPILAAMVELIYATSSRIGGVGNATAGEPTYGMSTLQVRHISVTPTSISYDYTGKKLARQGAKYPVKDPVSRKVHAVVSALIKDKEPTDNVFTYKGKPVLRAAVNLYLKSLGIELSIHSFRRIAGTSMALKLLKTSPFKKSDHPKQAAVDKWFKEKMKDVGALLHHRSGENLTGMTAIKAYIDPSVVIDFYTSLGLRKPTFLK